MNNLHDCDLHNLPTSPQRVHLFLCSSLQMLAEHSKQPCWPVGELQSATTTKQEQRPAQVEHNQKQTMFCNCDFTLEETECQTKQGLEASTS